MSGNSEVNLLSYRANQLEYEIQSESEELIVFSEVFYDKGWKAFVDGVETPHVRINYVLRGLKVKSWNSPRYYLSTICQFLSMHL